MKSRPHIGCAKEVRRNVTTPGRSLWRSLREREGAGPQVRCQVPLARDTADDALAAITSAIP